LPSRIVATDDHVYDGSASFVLNVFFFVRQRMFGLLGIDAFYELCLSSFPDTEIRIATRGASLDGSCSPQPQHLFNSLIRYAFFLRAPVFFLFHPSVGSFFVSLSPHEGSDEAAYRGFTRVAIGRFRFVFSGCKMGSLPRVTTYWSSLFPPFFLLPWLMEATI